MGLVIRLNSSFNNSSLPKLLADFWMRSNPTSDLAYLVDFARSGDHIYNTQNWVFNREIANFRWRIFNDPSAKITSAASPLAFHYGLSSKGGPAATPYYAFPFSPSGTELYPSAGTGYGKLAGDKGLFLFYVTLPLLSEITEIPAGTDYYISGGVLVSNSPNDFSVEVPNRVLTDNPRVGDRGPQVAIHRTAGGVIRIKVGDGVNTISVDLSTQMKNDLALAQGRVLQIAFYSVANNSCKLKVTSFVDASRTVSATGAFDIGDLLPASDRHLIIPYFGWPGHTNNNAMPADVAATKLGINRVVITNESDSASLADVENRMLADYNYIKETRNSFQNA